VEIDVRPYQVGDDVGIVALLDEAFDGWPGFDLECSRVDHWRWKYLDNPLRKKIVVLALSGERIVGCSHNLYLRIKIGDRVYIGRRGADLGVHNEFRDQGIYRRMTAMKLDLQAQDGPSVSYWTTVNPIVAQSNIREGHPRFPKPVIRLRHIFDTGMHFIDDPFYLRIVKKMGYSTLITLGRIRTLFSKPVRRSSKFIIKRVDSFDDRVEDFWNKVKGNFSFIVERNKVYLNWRYCDARAGNFLVLQAGDDDVILGYIVLRVERKKSPNTKGFIVDLLTLPERLDVADALIVESLDYFKKIEVTHVDFMVVSRSPLIDVFHKREFLRVGEGNQVFYQSREIDNLDDLKDAPAESFHFSFGDTDII
jgi:hypothetical protein